MLYVRYDWLGCGAVTTPLVEASSGPLGGPHSAKWFHCVHLPLALQPDRQQQEQCTAQPTAAGSGGGGAAMVLFQVRRACNHWNNVWVTLGSAVTHAHA